MEISGTSAYGITSPLPYAVVDIYAVSDDEVEEEIRALLIPLDAGDEEELQRRLSAGPIRVVLPWDHTSDDDDSEYERAEVGGEPVDFHRPPGRLFIDRNGSVAYSEES